MIKVHRPPVWLLVLFVVLLATATDEFVIAGVLPAVANDLSIPVAVAGQLITVFAVAYAVSAPLLALVTDRWPRRTVIGVGLAVFIAANVLAALASGYPMLMGTRVLAAAAAATVTSASFATAAAGAPDGRQGRYLAVVVAGMTVALFTGVPVGAWLAGVYGWRATFWLIAAVGALAAIAAMATAPRIPGSAPAPLAQRLAPLHSPALVRMLVATLLCGSGGLMFYTYLGPLTSELAGSVRFLPLILLIVGGAGIGGALSGGRVTDAFGPRGGRLIVIGGHAAALLVLAAATVTGVNIVLFGVLVAVWSVFAWALNPPMQASVLAAAPHAGMTALALNISALYLGTGIAGALGGIIAEYAVVSYIPLAGAGLLTAAFLAARARVSTPVPESDPAMSSACEACPSTSSQ